MNAVKPRNWLTLGQTKTPSLTNPPFARPSFHRFQINPLIFQKLKVHSLDINTVLIMIGTRDTIPMLHGTVYPHA